MKPLFHHLPRHWAGHFCQSCPVSVVAGPVVIAHFRRHRSALAIHFRHVVAIVYQVAESAFVRVHCSPALRAFFCFAHFQAFSLPAVQGAHPLALSVMIILPRTYKTPSH